MSAVPLHAVSGATPRQASAPRAPIVRQYTPPAGMQEAVMAALMRLTIRFSLKPFLGPPWPVGIMRAALALGGGLMPPTGGVTVTKTHVAGPAGQVPVERIVSRGAGKPRHAVLYLHGGAFCTGSPRTHRSITTRLARFTGAEVMVPDYRLVPEHPFPAPIDDCIAAYERLLADGYAPERIAVAGDSAGGTLTLWTALSTRLRGLPQPGVLVMISPLTDPALTARSITERASRDPMIRMSWGRQAAEWLQVPHDHPLATPTDQDLTGMPPLLVQVGEDEVLYDDSTLVTHKWAAAGSHAELERHDKRWHVFQSQAGLMPGSTAALRRQAEFMKRHWAV